MIAYNTTSFSNIRLLKKATQWFARQLLSAEQYAAITARYKVDFYTPNLFIKIGLFIFTWISVGAAAGLFALLFASAFNNGNAIGFFSLLCAAGCTVLLETLIRQRKLYRSGIDEALLYAAILFTGGAIGSMFSSWFGQWSHTMLLFTMLLIPVLAAATIRYADTLVAVALALCCYTVYFLLVLKLGAIAKMIMPFALMLLSAVFYFAAKKLQSNTSLRYWQTAIIVFEAAGLLVFYLSGNYYAIRESGIQFFDMRIGAGQDIPLAFVFYIFTALVPVLYVWYGLKRHDRVLLWVGLAMVVLSALTFKHYFSTGHPEIILVVAGMLMIVIAYAAIQYLKTPRHRITFEEEEDENNFLKTNAEALLQARSFGQAAHHAPAAPATEFGGGSSGGGGATGDW